MSLACLGADYLAHAVSPAPWPLLVFHALAGACAGTNTVVNAYIADVTEPQRRARAYGLVGSAFAAGFVDGPTLGGLLGAVDVRLPFLAAAGLALANVAYGYAVLPESWPGDRTTPLTLRVANPVEVPVAAGAVFAWSLPHAMPGLVFAGAAVFAAASTLVLAATPATVVAGSRAPRSPDRA